MGLAERSFGLVLVAGIACLGAAPREPPYEPLVIVRPAPATVRSSEASALVGDVNRVRGEHGLPGVAVDGLLAQVALAHARDMAQRHFFGHVTPEGQSLPDRLAKIGFPWTVAEENIALDEDEQHANAALLQSGPHRANMLDSRVRTIGVAALGVGVGAVLYVEDFAG